MLIKGRAIACWTTMVWMLRLKPLTIRRMYTFCKNLLLAIDTYRASTCPRRVVFILTELLCINFSEVPVREQWLQAQSGPLGFCLFLPAFSQPSYKGGLHTTTAPSPFRLNSTQSTLLQKPIPATSTGGGTPAVTEVLVFCWKHQKPDRCFLCLVCQPTPGSSSHGQVQI